MYFDQLTGTQHTVVYRRGGHGMWWPIPTWHGLILPMEYIVRCHLINGMACGSTYTTHGMVFDSHRADTTFGMSQRILPMASKEKEIILTYFFLFFFISLSPTYRGLGPLR